MNPKYNYTMSSAQLEEKQKHRQILKNRIKIACWIAITVLFFVILGIAGGLERDLMTLGEFILYAGLSVSAIWVLFRIANKME